MIRQIDNKEEKKTTARTVLEALPEWFGIPEARENYISGTESHMMFGAYEDERPVGFLCLKETGKDTVELYVMGILKEYHRMGIGTKLFAEAKAFAGSKGYSFMQVKTVQMGNYQEYDNTNCFYLSLGFKEFEVFPTLWDKRNPCQIYVMNLP